MKKAFKHYFFPQNRLVFLALLIAVVAIIRISPERAAAIPDSTLYFDPPTQTQAINQDLALQAKINPASNQVTAVELQVTFDQTRFRLDSIDNTSSPFSVILQAGSINNNNGTASIIVGVPAANPAVPVTATALIATFNFHSLGAVTNSPIAFTNSSLAAAIGESGDVLTARTPASITITGTTYNNASFVDLRADWMETIANSPADVNSDGIVNSRDLGIMMSNWQ